MRRWIECVGEYGAWAVARAVIEQVSVIAKHKYYVGAECFKRGLYWRGVMHDMSKFLPSELYAAVVYYGLSKKERRYRRAYYRARLLHTRRNDHHAEYWRLVNGNEVTVEMDERATVEMVCDWIALARCDSTRYDGWSKRVGDETPEELAAMIFVHSGRGTVMHRRTRALVYALLGMETVEKREAMMGKVGKVDVGEDQRVGGRTFDYTKATIADGSVSDGTVPDVDVIPTAIWAQKIRARYDETHDALTTGKLDVSKITIGRPDETPEEYRARVDEFRLETAHDHDGVRGDSTSAEDEDEGEDEDNDSEDSDKRRRQDISDASGLMFYHE